MHCHHGAVLTYDSERSLLERMGLELDFPASGCCGMAGSFGYERGPGGEWAVSRLAP